MISIEELDREISRIMHTQTILSYKQLQDKLPKYKDKGLNWYIREKYLDFLDMNSDNHRYSVKK